MKYELVRLRAGETKSLNPLRDDEIEFESKCKLHHLLDKDESFSFTAPPRNGVGVRVVTTSHVVNIYQLSENSIGFDTETGSKYLIRQLKLEG